MAAALGPADLTALAAAGRTVAVARNDVVPLDGAEVALAGSGWFRLVRDAAFVRGVTLALAGPGELLAPGALFGDRSAESAAHAVTDGTIVRAPAEAVARQAERSPGVYAAIARSLARRLLRVQRRVEAVSRAPVEARVAAALLELAEQAGLPAGDGTRLDLPLPQATLAGLAGTTRESCSSAVASLARAGLVRGRRLRGLVLLDTARLSELAAVDFRQA